MDSEHINEKKVKENEGDSKIIVSVLELVKMGKSLYKEMYNVVI